MSVGSRSSSADPDREPKQDAIANVCLKRGNALVKEIVAIVSRAPIPAVTDVQHTQLTIAVAMALREVAATARDFERRSHGRPEPTVAQEACRPE